MDQDIRLFVPMEQADFEILRALVRRERRHVQQQAAHLLSQVLRAHGLGAPEALQESAAQRPLVAA